MPPPEEPLTLELTLRHVRSAQLGLHVPASFHYDVRQPFTVGLVLDSATDGPVGWQLSRELLYSGTRVLSGIGDVRIWPTSTPGGAGTVRLRLGPSHAFALFEADRAGLRTWIRRTFDLVPAGTESRHIDWDSLAHRLLSDR